MLYAILVLRDSTHGASLLARNGDVNDSVVGTSSETLTAADTYLVVDFALRCLRIELDSALGTSVLTSTSNATTAKVGNIVVGANARRASLVNNAHNVVLDLLAVKSTLSVV
jgi:hypothetical protein